MSQHRPTVFATAMLTAAVALILPATAQALGGGTTPPAAYDVRGLRADRVVAPAALTTELARLHAKIPAFSRQTGFACGMCHYQFPQLTPFGRLFKLNGYTMTGLKTITQPGDTASLSLVPIPGVAAMAVISATRTAKAQPGTQNNTAQMPQEFSVFLAGAITPKIGAFTQFTYAGADGSIGIDNVDVRYATHTTLDDRDLIFGVTAHNNPGVQDVWNTVPAWGFPFMASEVTPEANAGTLVDGGLEQQVLGLGAYALFNQLLYTEVTAYRSSPQGAAMPIDGGAENTSKGIAPYWRAALQHVGENTYAMVGTYGMTAKLYPAGVTGPTNGYTDLALDAQLEQKQGATMWIGRAAFIHESQHLDATFANGESANATNNVSTARASVSVQPSLRFGATLGFFDTFGSTDTLLYAPGEVSGSRLGTPNTSGLILELDHNMWQNARLGLEYVAYSKFNGSSADYDASGRRAADNNTLYAFTWIAF